jgi:hypothetical protein
LPDFTEPDSPLAEILNEAIELIDRRCEEKGYREPTGFIICHVEHDIDPHEEPDATSAGFGYDDSRDLVADLAGHFVAAAKAHGIHIELHTLLADRRDS